MNNIDNDLNDSLLRETMDRFEHAALDSGLFGDNFNAIIEKVS